MLLLFSDLESPALILLPRYLKLRQQFDLGIHLLPAHRGRVNGITILLLKYKVPGSKIFYFIEIQKKELPRPEAQHFHAYQRTIFMEDRRVYQIRISQLD